MLGEHWKGGARGYANALVLALGTGLGTGMLANGKLVRAGRMLHPEGGHLILRADDRSALCGCGNFGCAEAFLSGNGFTRRARAHLKDPELTSRTLMSLAKNGNSSAKKLFSEYAHLLAVAIHNYAVAYAPEVVVITGGFAAAAPLFLKETRSELTHLLRHQRIGADLVPKLVRSPLKNQSSLVGAAFVALHPRSKILSAP